MNAHAEVGAFTTDLARVVGRARRRWGDAPFAAFVVGAGDPLGAAIVEMLRWLNLGLFLHGEATWNTEARAFVVGAASLAELRLIVAGLADADRGLVALGERRETPGAGKLGRALSARGPLVLFLGLGLRRVRRLDDGAAGLLAQLPQFAPRAGILRAR